MARLSVEELANLNITIYAFHDDQGFTTGGLVTPGIVKTTRKYQKHVNALINDVTNFFFNFNGLLEDLLGSRLFFSEFQLVNLKKKRDSSESVILPKGVLLIPGTFKDYSNFVLSLEYELNLVDPYKGATEMKELCNYMNQIIETTLRPELKENDRHDILENFSRRNAKKLYGLFIDKTWQRKFIGEKDEKRFDLAATPTDVILSGGVSVNYEIFPPKSVLDIDSIRGLKKESTIKDFLYLKEMGSIQGVKIVAQTLFSFASNLFKPLKESTRNLIETNLLDIFLTSFSKMIESFDKPRVPFLLRSLLSEELEVFEDALNSFHAILEQHFKSGERATLKKHFDKIKHLVLESKVGAQQSLMKEMYAIFLDHVEMERDIQTEEKIPAWDLNKYLNFIEFGKRIFPPLKRRIDYYLGLICERDLLEHYLEEFKSKVISQQDETIRIISGPYLERFQKFVQNEIRKKYFHIELKEEPNERMIEDQFQNDLIRYAEEFISRNKLKLEDLIVFTGTFMKPRVGEKESEAKFSKIFNKLKAYPTEIRFITDYIARYSVFNSFLKEAEEPLSEPGYEDKFSPLITDFLENYITIPLHWKVLIKDWIRKFGEKGKGKVWTAFTTIAEFQRFLEQVKKDELKPDRFRAHVQEHLINKYQQENAEVELALMRLFRDIFKQSIEISETLPHFLQNNLIDFVKTNKMVISPKIPKEFLFGKEMELKSFIENLEILRFPQLSCRPSMIILQNKKIPELQTKIHFTYSGERQDQVQITTSSNYPLVKHVIQFKYT